MTTRKYYYKLSNNKCSNLSVRPAPKRTYILPKNYERNSFYSSLFIILILI